jgi:hypothetical protein
MPAEPPTKSPAAIAEKPATPEYDAFHPQMPQIPGLNREPRKAVGADSQRLVLIGGMIAAVLIVSLALQWWIKSAPRKAVESRVPDDPAQDSSASATPFVPPASPVHQGPVVVATVEEVSKPWTSKKFTYENPLNNEMVGAMVIRLPNKSLWAFSLQVPFGQCELELVTDLGRLEKQFRYQANHPMVADACSNTVYDPLKAGSLGGDVWARGEIVQGTGLRPPLAIDVRVSGHNIIADRME